MMKHPFFVCQESYVDIELSINNVKVQIEEFSPKFVQKIRNEYLRRSRQLHKSKKKHCRSNSIPKSFSIVSNKYYATTHAFVSLAHLLPKAYLVISVDENPSKYVSPVLNFEKEIVKDLRYQCLKEDTACFKNCHVPLKKKLYRKLASLCVDKNELRPLLPTTNFSCSNNEKHDSLITRTPFHYQRSFNSKSHLKSSLLENTGGLEKIQNVDWLVKLKATSPLCKMNFRLEGMLDEKSKIKRGYQNSVLAETSVLLDSHLYLKQNQKLLTFKVAIPFSSLSLDQYSCHMTKSNEDQCVRQFRFAIFDFTLDFLYHYPHMSRIYFPLFWHYWFLSKPEPYKRKKSIFYQRSFVNKDSIIMERLSIDNSFYLIKKCYLAFCLILFWKNQCVTYYKKLYQWENPRESLAVIFLAIPLFFPRLTLGLLLLYTACFLFYLCYFFPRFLEDPFSKELNQLKSYGDFKKDKKINNTLYSEALLKSFNSLINSSMSCEIRSFLYLASRFLKIIFPSLIYFHTSFTGYSFEERQEFYNIALQPLYADGEESLNFSTACFYSVPLISSSKVCKSLDFLHQGLCPSREHCRQKLMYCIYILFILSVVILLYPTKVTSLLLGCLCCGLSYYFCQQTFLMRIIIILFQCCQHSNIVQSSKCYKWFRQLH